ncbi:hypothetical protein AAG906_026320 [Vitis piasezkii]
MGQGYEDHLITGGDIPRSTAWWKKIDAVASLLSISPTGLGSIYLYWSIASLKEQFLTVMPLTHDVGAQQTLDKFFMVLTLIGLRPDLEPIRDRFMVVHRFRPWMMCLLASSVSCPLGLCQRPHCTYCNKLGHTRDRCYRLHGRPPRRPYGPILDSPPRPQSSSASRTSRASIASVARLDLFSSITTTSIYLITLANGSQTVAKGRESQGLYHLTSIHLLQFAFPRCSVLIHNRLATLVSPSSEDGSSFSTLSSLPCESCRLGKHTRVSLPKRLNNRAKSPLSLST